MKTVIRAALSCLSHSTDFLWVLKNMAKEIKGNSWCISNQDKTVNQIISSLCCISAYLTYSMLFSPVSPLLLAELLNLLEGGMISSSAAKQVSVSFLQHYLPLVCIILHCNSVLNSFDLVFSQFSLFYVQVQETGISRNNNEYYKARLVCRPIHSLATRK